MGTWQLSKDDFGRTISVKKGDDLVITLAENPTTGFRWSIEFSKDILQLAEAPTYTPAGAGIGGGGGKVIKVVARDAGECDIKLKQSRPWEKQPITDDDIKFHVEVSA